MQWSEKVLRGAAEPIIGVGWGILWIIAEVGRGPQIAFPLILLGLAIAVSRLMPWVTLVLTTALILVQVPGPEIRFTETSWPAYLGLLIVPRRSPCGSVRW
jgi:hypothetical protein